MIAESIGLESWSTHEFDAIEWPEGGGAAVQVHCFPEPHVLEVLDQHGVTPVTVARHPLDVLISILRFSADAPETGRWIDGRGGDEALLEGATPVDEAFREYALGDRAAALLDVTCQWWTRPDVVRARYEELRGVDGPTALGTIVEQLGGDRASATEAYEESTLKSMGRRHPLREFHMGLAETGHWRRMIPTDLAREIRRRHAGVFDTLGYDVVVEDEVGESQALEAWLRYSVRTLETRIDRLRNDAEERRRLRAALGLDAVHAILRSEMGPEEIQEGLRLAAWLREHPGAREQLRDAGADV